MSKVPGEEKIAGHYIGCSKCDCSEKFHDDRGWGFNEQCPFDPQYPCLICQEPVIFISTGGSAICPWCDMGKCRYCGVTSLLLKEELDGGKSLRGWRHHMEWHKKNEMAL